MAREFLQDTPVLLHGMHQEIYDRLCDIADGTDPLPMFLLGPSGTGKTTLARRLHARAAALGWNTAVFNADEQTQVREAVPRILKDGRRLLLTIQNCHWWVLDNPRYLLETQALLEFLAMESTRTNGRLRTVMVGQGALPQGDHMVRFFDRMRLMEVGALKDDTVARLLGSSDVPPKYLRGLEGNALAADLVKYLAASNNMAVGELLHRLLDVKQPLDGSGLVTPSMFMPEPPVVDVLRKFNDDLLRHYASRPQDLYRLTPREFEEFVAELWSRHGWTVELTKQTRDGGADIIAIRSDTGTPIKVVVEAKRYARTRPVEVGLVRQLAFVKDKFAASKAVLATTSYFSRDATNEVRNLVPHVIDLHDLDELQRWTQRALSA
jgi:hypothetical protein